ncbi:MAG: AAA family ATPase, partial [Deltaproteobacteria bacterium]|nr:AAA family ATPase [Deltaproteobacteria bacterium]
MALRAEGYPYRLLPTFEGLLREGSSQGRVIVDLIRDLRLDQFDEGAYQLRAQEHEEPRPPGSIASDRELDPGPARLKLGLTLGRHRPQSVSVRSFDSDSQWSHRGPWLAARGRGWMIAGYGPQRRLQGHSNRALELMQESSGVASLVTLFHDDASLAEATVWLRELALRSSSRAALAVEDLLVLLNDGLLPDGMSAKRVDDEGTLIVEQDGLELPLDRLSDGYRAVAALVFDILYRLSVAYGVDAVELDKSKSYPRVIIGCPGVVLIDEVETHLHPSWQKQIGFWLVEHFPNLQFIVTTHSAFVCQAALHGSLIRLSPPGDPRPPGRLDGRSYWTVVNGSPDEAALTELFGLERLISADAEALRDEVAELFGEVANEIKLLELDSTPLLTNTLEQIKHACGDDWQNDKQNPNFNCDLTPLGQTFEGEDGTWETSAEFSMIRILTMTPANSVVDGTSLDTVAGLSNFLLGLSGGFSALLANSLEIDETEEFLDTAPVVASLRKNLLETHPEVQPGGKIDVYLADALTDMATLADRLGPAGDHPGVLVPDFPTYGEVFGPDFQMNVVAESNLRVLDGVDLSAGKDFISVIVDLKGPTFDDEAEFDFQDPAKFSLSGLTPNPTLDMRFAIYEHDSFVESCTSLVSDLCIDNAPANPVGSGLVWSLDPWDLEYLVADAGRTKYASLQSKVNYFLLGDVVEVGQEGDPFGWARFSVPLNIGEPPNQYVWELINEVAQHDLHYLEGGDTPTFAEGEANVEFTLSDIPVGITGEEAANAVRPYLQAQASDIAGYLLGNYKENSGPVDFYYRRADDGVPYLFWVAPDDLLEGKPYGWQEPGFYADPGLNEKLSSTQLGGVGESMHEKLAISEGETIVYAADDEQKLYRIRIVAPAATRPRSPSTWPSKSTEDCHASSSRPPTRARARTPARCRLHRGAERPRRAAARRARHRRDPPRRASLPPLRRRGLRGAPDPRRAPQPAQLDARRAVAARSRSHALGRKRAHAAQDAPARAGVRAPAGGPEHADAAQHHARQRRPLGHLARAADRALAGGRAAAGQGLGRHLRDRRDRELHPDRGQHRGGRRGP